ncbi:MAG: ABC transporter permease, partial [Clostridiales bacterium]|nr:ABC transporter permease [Clostridiales bacterium]
MKLWSSYLKELKLSSKGFYFYVEIAMTVILLIVLLFVIPENYTGTQEEYLTLDLPKSAEEMFVSELEKEDKDGKAEVIELKLKKRVILADLYEWEGQEVYIIEDEKDMIDLAEKDRPLIGASLSWNEESSSLKYDYYIQGYESDRLKNFYKIINNKNINQIVENSNAVEVKSLETGYEQLNTRQTALPALLTFNGSLMGMFIMAAYIFLDKGEGVIKAYAVT